MSAGPPHAEDHAAWLDAAQWRRVLAEAPLLFEVMSNSMVPTFRAGERVLIRPLAEQEPRCGQVLAYLRGTLVTHRYLGGGVCRGDNALTQDSTVAPEDMVGIIAGVERNDRVLPLGDGMPLRTKLHRLRVLARGYLQGHHT